MKYADNIVRYAYITNSKNIIDRNTKQWYNSIQAINYMADYQKER